MMLMTNSLLALIISVCLLLGSAKATEHTQSVFLAVFHNPTVRFQNEWQGIKVNLRYAAPCWELFHEFLSEVVIRSAGYDQVVIDIDSHGDDDGLMLQYVDKHKWVTKICSVGYICKEIDEHLHDRQVILLLEGCYSGRAYKHTIRDNEPSWMHKAKYVVANFNQVPSYPVYGIGSVTPNFGNYIYLQYSHPTERRHFEDLRKYEAEKLGKKEKSESRLSYLAFIDFCALKMLIDGYFQ